MRQQGRMTGEVEWRADNGGFEQLEQGELRLGAGPKLRAERRYFWREDGAAFEVFFDDGRPFHRFTAAEPYAEHACAPDHYSVRYELFNWPDWRSIWRVTGPRKDAVIESHFRPL